MMKHFIPLLLAMLPVFALSAQGDRVTISDGPDGTKLIVNGKDFMVNGMNWDYFPIGTTVTYSLWKQPDDIIRAALDEEMTFLRNMGVNAVRQYTGVPPRWIKYIYEKYGIYTMLNHAFGRYGLTIDGAWMANTEYADPRVRELLLKEVTEMAQEYKDVPGVLLFLLGNENNYGLFWGGAETEDIPVQDRKSTIRARAMYKLFNEAVLAMKQVDTNHPIAMCNGDELFLELIVQECPDVDIYGTNMYRGESFGDFFAKLKNDYGKPILFTEFGADAFNAISLTEDQLPQAHYMVENWKEIYANAAGMGGVGNSLGGFTFQFSDGWWKVGQTDDLDLHNTLAGWDNGGYPHDFVEGEDNMNEEWFGVCAKGPTNERGLYSLYPRAAYYALKEAHRFDPFAAGASPSLLNTHFANINLADALTQARGDAAALIGAQTGKVRLSRLSAELSAINTGGSLISTPKDDPDPTDFEFPNQLGFDHMQSFFVGVAANPAPNVRADVSFNILGNVAQNPINQIFYEDRGRPITTFTTNGLRAEGDINRLAVYQAEVDWEHDYFNLKGFYRTGHYHWGYEGDFFGLYPEANYGPNIDIYNGTAPSGIEVTGKKGFKNFKMALGPELWWGANPAILLKYHREHNGTELSAIFHEDLEQRGATESSFAIPMPKTRRATLGVKKELGNLGVEVGGIWAGQPLNDRVFQLVTENDGDFTVYQDKIKGSDNWGGKMKLTYAKGKVNWYAQAAAMGLVAQGGVDPTITYTGWRLKDSGSGNQYNFLTGFTYLLGDLQIAPNFLWQRPIEGPIPGDVSAPGRPRNILTDPFVVRANRETVAGEILFTYDPTPGTFMYNWDNDDAEDAKFAASAGFVFRHLPTTQDAAIGIDDERRLFAFPGAPPARDLWEAHAHFVSKISADFGWIANVYTGEAQANGSDTRIVQRTGADVRIIYKKLRATAMAKFNDWGPYDFHRDFNLTFPTQLSLDLSTTLGKPSWFALPETKLGVMGIFRTLDEFSPRYCPTRIMDAAGDIVCDRSAVGFDNGQEWEIRTYLHINVFQ